MLKGILVIDKEKGKTSRDIVNDIVHKFNIKRVGHTGTLDPLATGVLVVAVGEACKIIELLTSNDKEYIAEVLVGIETDTLDITGKKLNEEKVILDKKEIERVLNSFKGEYYQEVPKYSAVHVDGKRLYEYARSNEDVVLPKRKVTIKDINLLDIYQDEYQHFTFRVSVSKGCYIRSLIRDIAKELDCYLTMENLRRIRQGIFQVDSSKRIDEVSESDLITMTDALKNLPKVVIHDKVLLKKINNGMKLERTIDDITCFVDEDNELLAIYYPDGEIMRSLRVFVKNNL